MKSIVLTTAFCLAALGMSAQTTPDNISYFELGRGLNFSLNEGAYTFKLSGMMQPYIAFERLEDNDPNYYFNSKRTYFNFSGNAADEKVSFFFQLDFSRFDPLLDAYITYNPIKEFKITAGQKQNITNNREMLIMEDQLQFPERGLLSTEFSRSGREFGLFLENTFGGATFAVVPQVSLTSGDGRNSFGVDSRDIDLGGVKYGARLDVYVFGLFTDGNERHIADLVHEPKPKLVIGGAASYNDGTSNKVGEGHGDFLLYNNKGEVSLPDYRQVYGDILFKLKGFSLLGEYVVATATGIDGYYTDMAATEVLVPGQISEFLALGTALNTQVGYVTQSGYALDLRYSSTAPEFDTNPNSTIAKTTAYTAGFSKYFKMNALKIQLAVSSVNNETLAQNTIFGELLFQVIF